MEVNMNELTLILAVSFIGPLFVYILGVHQQNKEYREYLKNKR